MQQLTTVPKLCRTDGTLVAQVQKIRILSGVRIWRL